MSDQVGNQKVGFLMTRLKWIWNLNQVNSGTLGAIQIDEAVHNEQKGIEELKLRMKRRDCCQRNDLKTAQHIMKMSPHDDWVFSIKSVFFRIACSQHTYY